MSPEINDPEEEKYRLQQELMAVLDKKEVDENAPLLHFKVDASTSPYLNEDNELDIFASLIAPKLREAQILDLFCGLNLFKTYGKKHNFSGQVTGVDISSKKADIKADVAKIDQILPPVGQFDIVTSTGSVPDIENYETTAKYLKEDGLYITGGSSEIAYECVLPIIEKTITEPQDVYQKDTQRILEVFFPVAMVDIENIPNNLGVNWSANLIAWRKRKK